MTSDRGALHFTRAERVRYRSSTAAVRAFCGRCGTPLTDARDDEPETIDVTTASFDLADELPPRDRAWTSHSGAWTFGSGDLPRHPEKRSGPGE